ncbi:MAG TPA: Hsp20/alpha crystallin family protein [Gammaproteobacteria bacterium]|nr:Hsp20/alpha crystallin family protein [Gammaproteobacteria bacterium]
MALVNYDPWSFVNRLHEDINKVFNDWAPNGTSAATAVWVPPADVEEYADRFQVNVDLPGVAASDVEITLHKGVLTLSGERRRPENEEQLAHRRAERGHGRFRRRFLLPDTANPDAVEAKSKDGVLEIRIPKRPTAMPRRIAVAA